MNIIAAKDLVKIFDTGGIKTTALKGISFTIAKNSLTCLVGADGAGKTTLLRVIAQLLSISSGQLTIFNKQHLTDPKDIHNKISYMPQRFGLYEDLSIQENIDLYTDMYGVSKEIQRVREEQLLNMAGLKGFEDRLAGKLSGGMKQKLALICALIRVPEILILDEPTVGVDPLSRRELWEIILKLIKDNPTLTVIVSTSYMDEAELADRVIMLHEGEIIADSTPMELANKAQGISFVAKSDKLSKKELTNIVAEDNNSLDIVPDSNKIRFLSGDISALPKDIIYPALPTVENGFISLLLNKKKVFYTPSKVANKISNENVIVAKNLVKKFGDFTAVKHTTFDVKKGEIFGLLGPNGAGKTTTFRMLCGLLPPTDGTLEVAGHDAKAASIEVRRRLGYVAQKFSLYKDLTVLENLNFFANAYGIGRKEIALRIKELAAEFDFTTVLSVPTGKLPGGFQQRLSMACALLHKPDILFLDEPTSGADPLARREFWKKIQQLSDMGTTIVVTTHFMEEAEYCHRLMIQDMGEMLAIGTPDEIRAYSAKVSNKEINTMTDAFIAIVESLRISKQTEQQCND